MYMVSVYKIHAVLHQSNKHRIQEHSAIDYENYQLLKNERISRAVYNKNLHAVYFIKVPIHKNRTLLSIGVHLKLIQIL